MAPTEQTERARKYAQLAIDTWADVAANADSANARNQAAEMLMQWGYGKPLGIGDATMRPVTEKPAKEKPLGKKEALVEAAKNPDPTTAMGELMNQRAAQAKLNS
jgi:hypothetical protein